MPRNDAFPIPEKYDLWIGNEWVPSSSSGVLENRSPLTGELLCTVPDTNERDVAMAVQAVEAGRVWVNCYNLFPSGAAFGGTKASGFGREDAFETLLDFTQVKNVTIDYAPSRRGFYD